MKKTMSSPIRLLALCLVVAGPLSAAPESWTGLKIGMSAEQTVTLLGSPLLRSRGHGFETWTYDAGAEVVIHGNVVGWTGPATTGSAARSTDIWSQREPGRYYATLHTGLPAASPAPAGVAPALIPSRRSAPPAGPRDRDYIRG
ncbi:hypothetical protein Verru16b_03028 [Lacunisphaera limnophila]|uniref:Uncharacterized protein n=2 Tax=Lacunisphaera limnophila TaxID=1838286 RepID=A0A1D8AYI4_9BACT|nr:hypothetical protein Verru16b_03028 [Lacunisphaera limnophila]